MSNRFQELFRLPPNLYTEGCPVIIEAGALQKDTITNKVLVQLKMRNLSEQIVIACKVSIRAYESSGNEVEGISGYSYLDINLGLGKDFGSKTPIYLPNNISRRITVCIIEIVFGDSTIWSHEPCEWIQVPIQEKIVEKLTDIELQTQYALEAGDDSTFVPVIKNGLFQCTCGTINMANVAYCYKCGRTYDKLSAAIEISNLIQKRDLRVQKENKEREEKNRIEEQMQIKAKEKQKKIRKILNSVLHIILVILLAFIVMRPTIKNIISYNRAIKLLDNGLYEEARIVFETLGDFYDSSKMILESQYQKADALARAGEYEEAINLWKTLEGYSDSIDKIDMANINQKEKEYQEAISLLEKRKYIVASDIFGRLEDYKDSRDKKAECIKLQKEADYQSAIVGIKNGDYIRAINILKSLDNYKQSKDICISTCYTYACIMAEKKDFAIAIDYFEYAKGYKDADDKRIDAVYNYACRLLSKQKYSDAITQFEKCSDYKDTYSKILDAKYGYVNQNKNNIDDTIYNYLQELISVGYSGAQSIYNELYR